ncbi:hypothetical protein Pth03_15890 [Planotetraspora thailandica]|uniref:Pentapeptide repeat-containing protein n=1 Tax=Planotetraspora thailandica TaxID=487172 RepID=A0A8J3UYX6_9ACTN|nr:pentapeptide repeat-containing protein [Planotetraspora thailandica]GII53200.1 hypothetical protein Pth03_15890 [Planotetraspora thailandica]
MRIAPLVVGVLFATPAALITALPASAATPAALPASAAHAAAAGPCKPRDRVNLRGKDFTHGATLPETLRCADLTKAKLDEAELGQKDLTGAILRDASLKEADLTQAHLEYADLRGADLSHADLGQLRAKQADLRGAILIDAEAGQAEFPHADLTEAVMTRVVLTQADLTDADLKSADLRGAGLGQIEGRTADFTGAKLADAKFSQAHLEYAVLRNADLEEAEFTQASLQGADFTGASVEAASFTQADDVNLTGARGSADDVPDDAITPAGDGNPITDVFSGAASDGGTSLAVSLVIVSAVGLGGTLLIWGVTHRRRQRNAAGYAAARRAAEEDVTRLGEEIDALDFDMKINQVTGPSAEWRAALDAYEAAKQTLLIAQTPQGLPEVASAVQHGRQALRAVRSWLSDVRGLG